MKIIISHHMKSQLNIPQYSIFRSYEEGLPLEELLYLFQSRVDYILKFSPNAKIMINIRDAPTAYFYHDTKYRERLKIVVEAACLLKPTIFGLIFEVCDATCVRILILYLN